MMLSSIPSLSTSYIRHSTGPYTEQTLQLQDQLDQLDQIELLLPSYLHQHQHQHQQPSTTDSPLLNFSAYQSCSTPPPPESSSSAVASPAGTIAYDSSSPVYSVQGSPETDFISSFYHGAGSFSMPDESFPTREEGLSHTPPTPSIKVYQSSPHNNNNNNNPHQHQHNNQMLLQSGLSYEGDLQTLLPPQHNHHHHHHRLSSRAAAACAKPQTQSQSSPHRRTPSTSSSVSLPSAYHGYTGYDRGSSKPLPTPEQTPVQSSFLAQPSFPPYDPSSSYRNAGDHPEMEMAMRRAAFEQQRQQQQQHRQQQAAHAVDEEPTTTFPPYSLAPSVSTLSHNSPATPQTSFPEESEDTKLAHGMTPIPVDVHGWLDEYLLFDDTDNLAQPSHVTGSLSDPFQEEMYNPALQQLRSGSAQKNRPQTQPQQQQQQQQQYPGYRNRNVIADRLQAAQQGHMTARAHSPRDASPWAQPANVFQNALHQPSHMNSALRGMDLMSHGGHDEQPKTISPKDAMLEFHESPADNSSMPLFPSQAEASQFEAAVATTLANTDFSNDAFAPFSSASQNTPQPYFLGQAGADVLQYPAGTAQQHPPQHHQQTSAEFAATLAGLDSGSVDRKMEDRDSDLPAGRPDDTASEAGTYSCTYHGCTRRFETPARLQKHKREAHRQTTPGSHMLARDSSSLGARGLSARNSQAGPHKCERTNPSTGKPCNSIFSRPYDLTRHEDTIHNARKQKVRCHLCTEEKTFSRNDALTRHMRVVHPNVTWPGKQKRRGRDD
ncbi:hypothetical protein MauCBS54593_001975 [Microsporum audouinii]